MQSIDLGLDCVHGSDEEVHRVARGRRVRWVEYLQQGVGKIAGFFQELLVLYHLSLASTWADICRYSSRTFDLLQLYVGWVAVS